jgi:hypothetical protein
MRIGPLSIGNRNWWRFIWNGRGRCGIFRNREGVVPGRWGGWVLGIEFGSRAPGNWFGVLLKRIGLWPW